MVIYWAMQDFYTEQYGKRNQNNTRTMRISMLSYCAYITSYNQHYNHCSLNVSAFLEQNNHSYRTDEKRLIPPYVWHHC